LASIDEANAPTTFGQQFPAMKAIVLVGVMALVALAIFAVLSNIQRQSTDKLAQEDASGFFHEKKQEAAAARDLSREAFDQPNPVERPPGESGPSWVDRLESLVGERVRAIKRVGHRHQPRVAPPGVYFTLAYLSVRTRSGITGLAAGTQVTCVKDEGPVLLVKAGDLEFEVKRQYVTNDLDVADIAARNDAEAQQALAAYMAQQQQQAIEHRNETSQMQPSDQQ
jgi:hypothetical protein